MKRKRRDWRKDVLLEDDLLDFIPEKGIIDIITSYFVYPRGAIFVNDGPVHKVGVSKYHRFAFVQDVRWAPSLSKKNPETVIKYRLMSIPSLVCSSYRDDFSISRQKKPNTRLLNKLQKAKTKKARDAIYRGEVQSVTELTDEDEYSQYGNLIRGDFFWTPYDPDQPVEDVRDFCY